MHFETLFADLLGKHQTKLYRGLGHLKTLILLMSLEAPSITPGKVDLAKWAGFSYFCFVQVPPQRFLHRDTTSTAVALDVKVIKCRFSYKRAQRYIRLRLFPSTFR